MSSPMISEPIIQMELLGRTTGVSRQSMMIAGSGASRMLNAVDR
jgi:hypothetical protein